MKHLFINEDILNIIYEVRVAKTSRPATISETHQAAKAFIKALENLKASGTPLHQRDIYMHLGRYYKSINVQPDIVRGLGATYSISSLLAQVAGLDRLTVSSEIYLNDLAIRRSKSYALLDALYKVARIDMSVMSILTDAKVVYSWRKGDCPELIAKFTTFNCSDATVEEMHCRLMEHLLEKPKYC